MTVNVWTQSSCFKGKAEGVSNLSAPTPHVASALLLCCWLPPSSPAAPLWCGGDSYQIMLLFVSAPPVSATSATCLPGLPQPPLLSAMHPPVAPTRPFLLKQVPAVVVYSPLSLLESDVLHCRAPCPLSIITRRPAIADRSLFGNRCKGPGSRCLSSTLRSLMM